jgi:hypothetical protein
MRALLTTVRLALLACLCAAPSFAGTPLAKSGGWQLERDVEPPSYAWIEPERTNLNIDSVVLTCEGAGDHTILQLQIYLSTEGPLAPKGAVAQRLKDEPRAEIAIDGRIFPVGIFFADVYAVLADETEGRIPRMSERLLDAMTTGRDMVLRFDLLAERAGQPAAFDGEAVIALQAGRGGEAVSAVRRCTGATTVSVASARHDRR